MAVSYIHQVRGRVRVRSQAVKTDPECGSALKAMLERTPGVTSAEVSPLTGSILIRYRDEVVGADSLLRRLCEWGFLPEESAASAPAPAHKRLRLPGGTAHPSLGRTVVRVAVEKAIEKAVERSVIRLVSALL